MRQRERLGGQMFGKRRGGAVHFLSDIYSLSIQQSWSSQSPLFLESYANMHVKKNTDQMEFNQNMCRGFLKDKIVILKSFCSNLKGSVSGDFRPPVFFHDSNPSGP